MINIVTYTDAADNDRPRLVRAFIDLNTEWIKTYFRLEEHDLEVFNDVKGKIIDKGGEVFVALDDGQPVGCCSLIHHSKENHLGEWELAKMAVSPRSQGKGVGSRLMVALIEKARSEGIKSIYLEGNTKLEASIHMYRKFGFKEIPLGEQNYERVDIIFKWEDKCK